MTEHSYGVLEIVEGTVSQVNTYEAIIDLGLGGQGSLHVVEVYGSYIPDALEKDYKVGQEDKFRVVSVDRKLGSVGLAPNEDF